MRPVLRREKMSVRIHKSRCYQCALSVDSFHTLDLLNVCVFIDLRDNSLCNYDFHVIVLLELVLPVDSNKSVDVCEPQGLCKPSSTSQIE